MCVLGLVCVRHTHTVLCVCAFLCGGRWLQIAQNVCQMSAILSTTTCTLQYMVVIEIYNTLMWYEVFGRFL